jgi:hypothetical protein
MSEHETRINIVGSFSSEGADRIRDDARGVREELEGLAESVEAADAALRDRYASAIEALPH